MAGHTSEKRWISVRLPNGTVLDGVSEKVSSISSALVRTLSDIEEKYQELLEIFNYSGGTAVDFASLLFKEDIAARQESTPNTEEQAKADDLIAAALAAHQIWQSASNVAVTQVDRMALLRRMS